MAARKWLWSLGLTALLLVSVLSRWSPTPGNSNASGSAPAPTAPVARLTLVGSASCSGRACHGSPEPGPKDSPKQAEFSIWCNEDPHRKAFDVLSNERSNAIARKLGLKGKASEEERCLACHTNPQAALPSSPYLAERLFGVGCESCHGPASEWLDPHTAPTEWATLKQRLGPDKLRQEYGMNTLVDAARRTTVCAGCHIGAPAEPDRGLPLRDMNHDFIAAGHPRLNFEMSSYLDNVPHHWPEKTQQGMVGTSAWAVGQVVSLQASLELLSDRARSGNRPWPEFSESDCYACHHDLSSSSWRQQRGYPDRKPGVPPWSNWYREMPTFLASRDRSNKAQGVVAGLRMMDRRMNHVVPDRNKVAEEALDLARKTLKPLPALWGTSRWDADELRSLRTALADFGRKEGLANWDSAWQVSLALLRTDQALRSRQMPPVPLSASQQQHQRELIRYLAFPPGFDSPLSFRMQPDFARKLGALFEQLAAD